MFREALIIIDMQGYFATAKQITTIRNCIVQINKAKRDNIPIIVLEYEVTRIPIDMGTTLPELKKRLDTYALTRYVKKSEDDGAGEVQDCLYRNGWNSIQKFRVCGVNIGACVADTVYTLSCRYGYKIDVIKRACNGVSYHKEVVFQEYSMSFKNKNVTLV